MENKVLYKIGFENGIASARSKELERIAKLKKKVKKEFESREEIPLVAYQIFLDKIKEGL